MADQAPLFLTARHLMAIYGGPKRRSLRSCHRDYSILRDVLKVGPYVHGIPLHKYAAYIDVSEEEVIRILNYTPTP